jgi:hypothetical protein
MRTAPRYYKDEAGSVVCTILHSRSLEIDKTHYIKNCFVSEVSQLIMSAAIMTVK